MKKKRPNPYLIDEENPELTDKDFCLGRPAIDVFTELWGKKKAEAFVYSRRGRPRKLRPKRQTTVRFDADILDAFRAKGRGWQSRMNAALRDWLEQQSSQG